MKTSPLNIWFIVEGVPSIGGGANVRNLQLITQLARLGHSVSVFCIVDDAEALETLQSIENVRIYHVDLYRPRWWEFPIILFLRVIPYMYAFRKSGIWSRVKDRLAVETPDVIQLEQVNGYYMISPHLDELKETGATIVLDAHNVEQTALSQAIRLFSLPRYLIGLYILPTFRRIENTAARNVDIVTACSNDDARFFKDLGCSHVLVTPNGVDTDFYSPRLVVRETAALFIGGSSYPPNADAIEWYRRSIHPIVKKVVPTIKWYAVGKNPPETLITDSKRDASIIPLGFVQDTRDILSHAAVCISPMRLGSGTSLKILEYMAMGRPIVSTAVGVRGIACTHEKDVLIAETPEDFTEAMVRLINNVQLAKHIGENARRLVEERYSWKAIAQDISREYRAARTTV